MNNEAVDDNTTSNDRDALELLTSLSEIDLQTRIIEPLFRELGFNEVRRAAGPNERGRDVVAIKEELGRPVIYGMKWTPIFGPLVKVDLLVI